MFRNVFIRFTHHTSSVSPRAGSFCGWESCNERNVYSHRTIIPFMMRKNWLRLLFKWSNSSLRGDPALSISMVLLLPGITFLDLFLESCSCAPQKTLHLFSECYVTTHGKFTAANTNWDGVFSKTEVFCCRLLLYVMFYGSPWRFSELLHYTRYVPRLHSSRHERWATHWWQTAFGIQGVLGSTH